MLSYVLVLADLLGFSLVPPWMLAFFATALLLHVVALLVLEGDEWARTRHTRRRRSAPPPR